MIRRIARFKRIVVCAVGMLTVAPGFGSIERAVAGPRTVEVVMKDHRFEPGVIEVRSGDTVHFRNVDSDLHSVRLVGHEDVLDEEYIDPGQSFGFTIPLAMEPGEYRLGCTIHVDMTATILVVGE